MSVAEAIADFKKCLTPQYGEGETRAMSRYVFEDFFGVKEGDASGDEIFATFLAADYEVIKNRLLVGEPVQYIVGFAWFYGLKFKVNNFVLIPRPETEELVEWILETTKNAQKPIKILDIGTGSGCIPVTLKVKNPSFDVHAVDVSESALITASRNAYRMNADVTFNRIDILNQAESLSLPHFDVIVSNPPYIPNHEKALMQDNVLLHEPDLALFVDDNDPLIFYKTIADFAKKRLNTEGVLFFECNEFNAHQVIEMLKEKGFQDVFLRQDMSGKDRMVFGRKSVV